MKKLITILIVLFLFGCSTPKSCELAEDDNSIFLLPKDIGDLINLESYSLVIKGNGKEYSLFKSKNLLFNEPSVLYSFELKNSLGKRIKFTSQYSILSNQKRAEKLMEGHKTLKSQKDYALEATEFNADDLDIFLITNEMLQINIRKSNIFYSFMVEGASISPDQIQSKLNSKISYLFKKELSK